ncbi:hypothetical protein COY95_01295 [Candidatus Woesearchaeota archaeon CG_4_10_14_0_8_um_filter_47_5]|nr:MAG: hypothetical protein COY95_01295 [Candidatus Woesearchaeota archaeon CG_4_10_14_0_8_um_filter_47_5]
MLVKEEKRFWSALVFFSSGALGLLVFSFSGLSEPLFPLLSGLFGLSGLVISFSENTSIPTQHCSSEIELSRTELGKAILGSSLGVFLIQFFPGMGPAQGAVIANQVIPNTGDRGYLAMVGAMGTMSVVFSLVTFYTLGKAKDGTIVVISKLLEIDLNSFLILVFVFLVAGSVSVFLTLFFSKVFSRLIVKVNYRMLVVSIMLFIVGMCIVLNGALGVLVLVTATAIGLIAPLVGVGRNHAMGCLILPVILYFMF